MRTHRAYSNASLTALVALLGLVGCAHEPRLPIAKATSSPLINEVKNGMTLLDRAAQKGDLAAVKSLIKAGALIEPREHQKPTDEREGRADSALIFAAASENAKVVAYLLNRGADVNFKGALGFTALMRTCAYTKGRLTQDIYRRDIFIPPTAEEKKRSNEQRLHIVRVLLKSGADVNAKSDLGFGALWLAEQVQLTAIAQILRAAGARD